MGGLSRLMPARMLVATLALALAATGCNRGTEGPIALLGATIIDGTGGPVLVDGGVLIVDGKIEALGSRERLILPRGTREIDVSGRFIIPGLIDSHARAAAWALPRYLQFGVTTVRDFGDSVDLAVAQARQASDSGYVGPRIFTAGAAVDGAGGSGTLVATTERESRRAVDQLSVAGVQFVATGPRLGPELLAAATDEAGTFGLPVAGMLGATDAARAVRLGVRSIEGLSGVPEAIVANRASIQATHRTNAVAGWTLAERAWATLDSASLARLAETVAAGRVAVVPTFVRYDILSRLDDSTVYRDAALRLVPDQVRSAWDLPGMVRQAGWTSGDFTAFRTAHSRRQLFVRELLRAGGTVVAGSDAPRELLVPGLALHQELEFLVRAGMSPGQALVAGTRDAARLLGADSLGVLQPGMVADLLVLTRNPLDDIRATRAIERVMVRGTLFAPDSLRGAGG